MTKELQDLAWSVLPKEFKEEVKKMFEEDKKHPEIHTTCGITTAYHNDMGQRLIDLFGIHNLISDAEGEEMLMVSRKRIQRLLESCKKYDERMAYWDLINLFGPKCLPDEAANEDNFAKSEPKPFKYSVGQKVILHFYGGEVSVITEAFNDGGVWNKYKVKMLPTRIWNENELDPYEEPKPAEPKFKVGDTASYVCSPTIRHKCTVTKVMQNEHSGKWEYNVMFEWGKPGMWIPESDLAPYTEPTDLDKESSTCTNDCPSQCPSQNFDNIVNRGFRDHNRLHIAAQIVAALYANYQAAKDFKSIEELVRKALDITDTLIKESEKGGSK